MIVRVRREDMKKLNLLKHDNPKQKNTIIFKEGKRKRLLCSRIVCQSLNTIQTKSIL